MKKKKDHDEGKQGDQEKMNEEEDQEKMNEEEDQEKMNEEGDLEEGKGVEEDEEGGTEATEPRGETIGCSSFPSKLTTYIVFRLLSVS